MENCNISFPRSTITLTAIQTVKGKPNDIDVATQVLDVNDNPCFILDSVNRDLTRTWCKPVPGMTILYQETQYLCSSIILSRRPKHPILMTRPLTFSHASSFHIGRNLIAVTPVETRCEALDRQLLYAQVFELENCLYCFLDKTKALLESKGFVIKKGFLIDYGGYRFQCTDVLDTLSPFRQVIQAKLVAKELAA